MTTCAPLSLGTARSSRCTRRWASCDNHTGIEQEEEYGCDECKKPIQRDVKGSHHTYLKADIFRQGGATGHLEFCSWTCCLKGLKKVRTDYFVSLPYLIYDDQDAKGLRAKDFFAAVRAFK
jgi:hypothetical protein